MSIVWTCTIFFDEISKKCIIAMCTSRLICKCPLYNLIFRFVHNCDYFAVDWFGYPNVLDSLNCHNELSSSSTSYIHPGSGNLCHKTVFEGIVLKSS